MIKVCWGTWVFTVNMTINGNFEEKWDWKTFKRKQKSTGFHLWRRIICFLKASGQEIITTPIKSLEPNWDMAILFAKTLLFWSGHELNPKMKEHYASRHFTLYDLSWSLTSQGSHECAEYPAQMDPGKSNFTCCLPCRLLRWTLHANINKAFQYNEMWLTNSPESSCPS